MKSLSKSPSAMLQGSVSPKSKAAVDMFLSHCQRKTYSPKQTIISAGDASADLYYIIAGSVTVLMEDEDGHEIILAYLNRGDFFGELGMFDENHRRSAWVRAKTRCEVGQISYTKLKTVLADSNEIFYALASQMAIRLRDTSRKVGDLAFLDVSGRVARALLDLCKQPDAMTHPDGMQIKVTRQELGRIVGCSREMVGRVLRDLEDHDLISVSGKTMVVFGTR